MMPWVHLHINQAGMVTPCCMASDDWNQDKAFGNIRESTPQEIWNGRNMREFRANMLRGIPDARCSGCYESEAQGMGSLRKGVNQRFAHKSDWVQSTTADGFSADSKPIYWDIRFSNLCNLRCRICNPWASSGWREDAVLLGLASPLLPKVINSTKDFQTLVEQLLPSIGELEAIYFAGGEPLLMDEHYQILDLLVSQNKTDVDIRYSTNLTTLRFKGRSVCELWKQFPSVEIAASLDDSHERIELQRKGVRWEQVVANRLEIRRVCPRVRVIVTPTVSVFNVQHLPAFHREWTERGLMDVSEIMPNLLYSPPEYSICILPLDIKRRVSMLYEIHLDWVSKYPTGQAERRNEVVSSFRNIINAMNREDRSDMIPTFVERCRQLDQVRGESIFDVIPELRPLLARYTASRRSEENR